MNKVPGVLDAPSLAQRLKTGHAGIIPTDTVPGLATLPGFANQIWTLKHRPPDKPLILMADCATSLLSVVDPCCHSDARGLAEQYWPGALTLVLPAYGTVVDQLNPGRTTLGVRIPACSLARSLLRLTGPLATSSANPAGHPAARSSREAAAMFPAVDQLGPQPWPVCSGLASTVLAWSGPGKWQVLRQGAVMVPAGC